MTMRMANQDSYLPTGGGIGDTEPILVRRGQTVILSQYMLHRRKDIWGPDAKCFIPGRWDGMKPGWEFIPFGGGPRKCIGSELSTSKPPAQKDWPTWVQHGRIKTSFSIIRLLQRFSNIELIGDSYVEKSSSPRGPDAVEAAKIPKFYGGMVMMPKHARVRFYRDS